MPNSTTEFLSPDQVLDAIEAHGDMKIADFGSGPGFFTIPIAQLLGEEGKVYAFDIQKSALEAIRSHARILNIYNIETFWTDLELPEATKLKNESIDLVLLHNILFQAEAKNQVINEAERILKNNGRAVVVEWDESSSSFGPPISNRINRATLEQLMTSNGFTFEKEFSAGSHHYGVIFKKI
ncbi:class I SAM-dependent methyltransferase [Patescibacteria group bacterium]